MRLNLYLQVSVIISINRLFIFIRFTGSSRVLTYLFYTVGILLYDNLLFFLTFVTMYDVAPILSFCSTVFFGLCFLVYHVLRSKIGILYTCFTFRRLSVLSDLQRTPTTTLSLTDVYRCSLEKTHCLYRLLT